LVIWTIRGFLFSHALLDTVGCLPDIMSVGPACALSSKVLSTAMLHGQDTANILELYLSVKSLLYVVAKCYVRCTCQQSCCCLLCADTILEITRLTERMLLVCRFQAGRQKSRRTLFAANPTCQMAELTAAESICMH